MKNSLVVDDEFSVIESLRLALKDRYKIFGAESGEEAIQLIKEDMPNLVILDIIMPGTDGLETLKQIVAFNKDLPVIMSFAVKPGEVPPGEEATLSWDVANADSITIEPKIGYVSANGDIIVTPTESTVYTLIASNAAGELKVTLPSTRHSW